KITLIFGICPSAPMTPKLRKLCPLQFKKSGLYMGSPRIACQASIAPNDPVAGNDDRDRIVADRPAYCLAGHGRFSQYFCRLTRQRSVSSHLSVRNPAQQFPDCLLESCSCGSKLKLTDCRLLPCKIP